VYSFRFSGFQVFRFSDFQIFIFSIICFRVAFCISNQNRMTFESTNAGKFRCGENIFFLGFHVFIFLDFRNLYFKFYILYFICGV